MTRIFSLFSSSSRGAGGEWFTGSSKSSQSLFSSLRLFALCMCGVFAMNWAFRGNMLGRCRDETEVVLPVRSYSRRTRYRELMAPEGHGFVDASDEK